MFSPVYISPIRHSLPMSVPLPLSTTIPPPPPIPDGFPDNTPDIHIINLPLSCQRPPTRNLSPLPPSRLRTPLLPQHRHLRLLLDHQLSLRLPSCRRLPRPQAMPV